jgi:glycosyltransferase involved in cell wall biosynthesis
MPFALNESTEFISPTKTLEYMAAGKPVVSTPIHDVKAMFGHLVAVAATPELFIAACRAALAESPDETAAREAAMQHCVGDHSWDAAADTVRRALDRLATKPSGPDFAAAREARAVPDEEPTAARQVALAG